MVSLDTETGVQCEEEDMAGGGGTRLHAKEGQRQPASYWELRGRLRMNRPVAFGGVSHGRLRLVLPVPSE